MKVDPRSIREEGPWLAWLRTLDNAAELRSLVLDAGESQSVAGGIVSWLIAKKTGQGDMTSADTRARYRRVLADLGPPPTGRRRRVAVGDDGGLGNLYALVGPTAAGATTMALAGWHPLVAVLVGIALLGLHNEDRGDAIDSSGGQAGEAHVDAHVASIDEWRDAHHVRTSPVANAA